MTGSQRVYRQRIKSTEALQKMFRAQELIAASRIGKARQAADSAEPYARAITRAVSAVATHSDVVHTLTTERTDTNRVAVLVIASDRGMAGAYTALILRKTDRLIARLAKRDKQVDLFVTGRRAISYYRFRGVKPVWSESYGSDRPTAEIADKMADMLLARFTAPADAGGVCELHIVYTEFRNMVNYSAEVIRMLPLEVVEGEEPVAQADIAPLYDFEPGSDEVLDALLPRYIRTRVYSCLLEAAASELASRQRAMAAATDNAEDLIRKYTRLANQARQADITREISEIVSGADALAAAS